MKRAVYIANPESWQIHVWNLNYEDALTLAQVVDVPGQMQPMVVSPDKRYLYVDVRPESRVLAYRITPDNDMLTSVTESVLPGSPTHTSIDHLGQFVFVGPCNAGNVSVTCLEDGLPVSVIDVVEGLGGYHSANISPDNRVLWVPTLKQDCICLFTINDGDRLVVQGPVEMTTVEGAGPRHMMFHPSEQYAYYVSKLNSSVNAWRLKGPHGNIECVQTLDMIPENFSDTHQVANVHIASGGRHLYAYDHTVNLITIPSVPEDGSVSSKEGFQPTEAQPRGFDVDRSGKYLIAVGQKSHHISVYGVIGGQGLLHEGGRCAAG